MNNLFNNLKDDWDNLNLPPDNKLWVATAIIGTAGILFGVFYLIFFI